MIPVWSMSLPWQEITAAAYDNGLSPLLVAAMVQTESAGDTMATRYEPNYRWTVDIATNALNCHISLVTEEIHQQTSWGLLQIMGGTARDLGMTDTLPELLDEYTGLNYGCKYLARHIDKHKDIDKAIVSYNAGSPRYKKGSREFVNQSYLDKVKNLLEQLT